MILLLALNISNSPAASAALISKYEAEDQRTSGVQLGPDVHLGSLAAEASGRRAVLLATSDQSLDITLRAPAQGFTIRYAVPDSADGTGQDSFAVIKVGGSDVAKVGVTSRYSVYYGAYPFTNRPADGKPHHFWDEVRFLLPEPVPAGTLISIHPAAGSPGFGVDLVEAELVPPAADMPNHALSVAEFGADASGHQSSRDAFRRAIAAAQRTGKTVYAPPGRYRIDGHLTVDRVSISGAGPWYTTILGHHVGLYSRSLGSSRVALNGVAIESDVTERRDRLPQAAIGGKFSNSTFDDLYLHHAKVGIWLDGPAHDIRISNVRISDQAADGINLHRGIRRAVIEHNRIRNVGDDGIASWSEHEANRDIAIRHNSVVAPILANGIAIYGGRNIEVSDNWISDTLSEGGAIHLGTRFHSASFSGSIRIFNNSVVRSGAVDPHWHSGIGAIWIYALERPISAQIKLTNNHVEDALCAAVQLIGPHRVDGLSVDGLTISGKPIAVFDLQAPGSMSVQGVRSGAGAFKVDVPSEFQLVRKGADPSLSIRRVTQAGPPNCV